jgi:hypothetical protein
MPRYQLSVAIALAVAAACSVGLILFARTQERKIQLPLTGEEVDDDPFDVSSPEDVVDGYPVEENKFWAQVCTSV